MNHINEDAAEFGLHVRQGGWRLGLLVARSVEKSPNGTTNRKHVSTETGSKVSAREFAEKSGTSAARVLRYLKAWDDAAIDDYVPESALLVPGEELDGLDNLPDWSDFYDSNVNEGGIDKRNQFTPYAEAEGTSTGKAIHIAKNKAALKAAYKADPEVRKAVHEARKERLDELDKKVEKSRERAQRRPSQPEPVTPIDEAVSLMDGIIEEAGRRDELLIMLRLATKIHEMATNWSQSYGHTGVPNEIDRIHRISAELTETQWLVTGFAVEQEQDAR